MNVARFNYEKSPRLAKKLSTFSVPMIYSYVDGVRTPFLGEPSLENITVFMTRSLSHEVCQNLNLTSLTLNPKP